MKTDAPFAAQWDVLRCWQVAAPRSRRDRAEIAPRYRIARCVDCLIRAREWQRVTRPDHALSATSPGAEIIAKAPKVEADFAPTASVQQARVTSAHALETTF